MGKSVKAPRPTGVQFEALRVRRWRRDQFYELGFPLADARKLAQSPVDLGDARKVISKGCPPTLALRILL
jgi:hypothetical protein